MDEDLKEMIEGFVEDSREAFDSMEEDLMAMEKNPEDPSIMNNLFRVMHTLKGTAGFMGLTEISSLAHKLESVFDLVRQEKMNMTARLIDFLLPSIDQLKALVFSLIGEEEQPQIEETVRILEKIVETNSDAVLATGIDVEEDHSPKESIPEINFDHILASYQNNGAEAPVGEVGQPTPAEIAPQPEATASSTEKAEANLTPLVDTTAEGFSVEILKQFVLEAEEHLETIEENLLSLEEDSENQETIGSFFRAIHSIKGTAAYVNLKQIEALSHRIESIFDQIRKKELKYSKEFGDVVFKSIDVLRTMVFYIKIEDYTQVIDTSEHIHALEKALQGNQTVPPISSPTVPEKSPPPVEVASTSSEANTEKLKTFLMSAQQQKEVLHAFGASFSQQPLDEHEVITLHRTLKTLSGGAKYCELTILVNAITEYEELLLRILGGELEQTDEVLQNSLQPAHTKVVEEISRLQAGGAPDVAPVTVPTPSVATSTPPVERAVVAKNEKSTAIAKPATESLPAPIRMNREKEKTVSRIKRITNAPTKEAKETTTATESKTMRVDASRLDRFMNLIGELIIARNAFKHVADGLDQNINLTTLISDIKQMENNISRISENLQDNLMEMRLVQVKTVFQRMPRIVRDISRKANKKITLQMQGEHTEVDKSIVEEIGDPLVHIIRNSCDHGIESPEERVAVGKPEQGTIILRASHMGSFIAIDIMDDGRGVNAEKVKIAAVKKGVLSEEEAEKMSEEQAVNLIFAPGFSTAEQITDISGRGVGMDVVLTNIRNIQGTVDVSSKFGEGTMVRLKLPLTLAVIETLIVEANARQYAIPLDAIKETVQTSKSKIKKLKERSALEIRGEILGITPLSELLELETTELHLSADDEEKEITEKLEDEKIAIIVLSVNNKEIGILVDQLYSQQEIVVKPLEEYLANIPGLKGSTIMGDGQIVLILEPNELMGLATSL